MGRTIIVAAAPVTLDLNDVESAQQSLCHKGLL